MRWRKKWWHNWNEKYGRGIWIGIWESNADTENCEFFFSHSASISSTHRKTMAIIIVCSFFQRNLCPDKLLVSIPYTISTLGWSTKNVLECVIWCNWKDTGRKNELRHRNYTWNPTQYSGWLRQVDEGGGNGGPGVNEPDMGKNMRFAAEDVGAKMEIEENER